VTFESIDGSLWQSFNGYAPTPGQVDILIPGQPQLASDGPHLLEIRNRAERQTAGTTHRLRFKQLVVHDRSATLRTVQYTYDGLARLQEARYLPGLRTSAADADLLRREQFAFDRAGNRTQQSSALNGGAPTVTNYSYNAGNQMTTAGAATLTYDDNGNLINGLSGATWVWDRANRATMISNTPHQYDGLGNLIQGSWGKYLLDLQPSLSVVLRTISGSITENYVHSGRGLLAQQTDGQWFWSMPDGLGSIRGMVDNATLVRSYQNYDTFGNKTDGALGVGMLYGFTGEMHDVDVYLRARQYRPSLGIFTSRDPFEGMAARPLSLNGYSWVEGNVVNGVDPSGMVPMPNSQGFCPHGYVNVSGNCAPIVIRDSICSANDLLQARTAADPTMPSSDTILDLWLTQIKARCLLENGDSSLEKLAKLSDFVAGAYANDPRGYMDLMSQIVIGTYAGAGAAVRSLIAGGCAGWGRETRDCPESDLQLTDSGFHLDFQDGRNQVYHFWGGVASVGAMQNFVDFLYTLPLNFVGFQIGHEWTQGILCNAGVASPIGDSGASWTDYALTNVAFHMGIRFALGDLRPLQIGGWVRDNVGQQGPGRFGEFEGLRDLIPLPGGGTATCDC